VVRSNSQIETDRSFDNKTISDHSTLRDNQNGCKDDWLGKKKAYFFYIYYIYVCTNQEREVVGEYAKKKRKKMGYI
jgi:hypothetical protein